MTQSPIPMIPDADSVPVLTNRKITMEEYFQHSFSYMSHVIHNVACDKGFWDTEPNFGEKVALVHSELSEMLEAHRKGIQFDDKLTDRWAVAVEAADAIIRLMDMDGRYGWNLGEVILAKLEYNKSRPYKHGKAY